MAHVPGLNYGQTKTKSKASKADGRQCQVIRMIDHSRCVVIFTHKGSVQRAVLPLDRLYSSQGPCGHHQPPLVDEKLFCDMMPAGDKAVEDLWLVAFAWRGKLDSASASGPLSAVTGMLHQVEADSGVLLFVTPAGCRERCAFGRATVQAEGYPLPAAEPLSHHLQPGGTAVFDCRRTTAAAGCRWLADKVWFSSTSPGDPVYEEDYEDDPEPPAEERGEFILRVTLKSIVGRVDLVQNYKAVLTFEHDGQRHRALLLTAKYTFPEKATALERRDLTKVLSRGDQVVFTCHEYDKPDGTDRCGWFVMEAVKQETARGTVGREAGYFQSGHLYQKIGTVNDVMASEGLLHFVLDGRREVAWFSSQEVFINGRPCDGRLSDMLEVSQRVNFNAEQSPAPRHATWRCTCVWRGEEPTVEANRRHVQAAVVKKPKKSKTGKSSIDDLDDFEAPAVPSSVCGDSRAAALATVFIPPQLSPRRTASGNQGGGDPPTKQPARPDGGGGGIWAEEPALEPVSSGPSRPLSDASLVELPPCIPGPIPSPSRTAAAARQSPADRGSPSDPDRPSLLPLLKHSVPLPDPNLPRPPLLPSPGPLAWSAGDCTRLAESASTASQARAPPGLSASHRLSGPADPPGLSPAAPAAGADANYRRHQVAATTNLLGEPPVPQRTSRLLTPPLTSLYGYPTVQLPFWPPPGLPVAPMFCMTPLTVNQETLKQTVSGSQLPTSASGPTRTTSQTRKVPNADWEAAAAAFQTAPAPQPETQQQRPPPPDVVDPLSDRLAAAHLEDDPQQAGDAGQNGLDDMLDDLEADAAPLEEAEHQPTLPTVEPVSGRGQILAFVDETRGLAEWDRDGRSEQVMFNRDICYWFGDRMCTLDLTDCYMPGAEVEFECVPAAPEKPYQWVATHFQQVDD